MWADLILDRLLNGSEALKEAFSSPESFASPDFYAPSEVRVFNIVDDQDKDGPVVVYALTGIGPENVKSHRGPLSLEYVVAVWTKDVVQKCALSAAVYDTLQGYEGTVEGCACRISSITFAGAEDDKTRDGFYGRMMTFIIKV